MCGIVGYVSNQSYNLEQIIPLIRHRGPDGEGVFSEKFQEYLLGLGHVRLSIIDLQEASNQPLISICGNYVIVFNGEIYNYRELKDTILSSYNFKTNSDTEVIVALYSVLGVESLKLLDGMFAFALYDKKKNELIIARDHLGIKPLYLYRKGKSLFFGSEIKVFKGFDLNIEIDESALSEFLLNGFVYEPETGFRDVTKLRPGHYIKLRLSDQEPSDSQIPFWQPGEGTNGSKSLEFKIRESINKHLVSDVRVGLFFSAGVDSSLLLSFLTNTIKSMIVKLPDGDAAKSGLADDFYYAKLIAHELGVNSLKVIDLEKDNLSNKEFLNSIEQVSIKNEELISDYTFISSRLISSEARNQGLKVVLSGMGADEIFGGYSRYVLMRYYNLLQLIGKTGIYKLVALLIGKKLWFQKKVERFKSFFEENEFVFKYSSLVGYFSKEELRRILRPEYSDTKKFEKKLAQILFPYSDLSPLKKSILLDLSGFLSHNFMVADKSSMQESVEVRVPFANKGLFEYALSLPDNELVSRFKTKKALKDVLEKYLRKDLVNRSKVGFNPPLDKYIANLGVKDAKQYLSNSNLFHYCNEYYVDQLLDDHYSGKKNNTYKIYTLLYLSSWLNINNN
jgi:asparagine synthase (glutamine-hydrolysing)